MTDAGCSGYQYGLKLEGSHMPEDTIIDCDDVKVFIDPVSMPMLDGMSIDFSRQYRRFRVQIYQS